jgi:hypothetical protein
MKLSTNTRRILLGIVLIGAITGAWTIWYVFYKPHRNVGAEKATYEMKAADLSAAFKSDAAAVTKYIDKAILIEGQVSGIDGNHLSFDNIICNFDSASLSTISKLQVGQQVKVQGRLTTYNDLMEEIMMDQCVLK